MDLYRLGVKFFAGEGTTIALPEFIPVFHRWIQQKLLDDLLVDVADYSHVHAGPGVLLIAHEGNYGMDETGNRRGLVYYRKHPPAGGLEEGLLAICGKALQACRLLEEEPALGGRMKFDGRELQIFANDRLLAPNSEATFTALRPAFDSVLGRLYSGTAYVLERETDPKERFAIVVKTEATVSVEALLQRLSGSEK